MTNIRSYIYDLCLVASDSVGCALLWCGPRWMVCQRNSFKFSDLCLGTIEAEFWLTASSRLTSLRRCSSGFLIPLFLFNFIILMAVDIALFAYENRDTDIGSDNTSTDLENAGFAVLLTESLSYLQVFANSLINEVSVFSMCLESLNCKMLLYDWIDAKPNRGRIWWSRRIWLAASHLVLVYRMICFRVCMLAWYLSFRIIFAVGLTPR